jgi:hypothetical protein
MQRVDEPCGQAFAPGFARTAFDQGRACHRVGSLVSHRRNCRFLRANMAWSTNPGCEICHNAAPGRSHMAFGRFPLRLIDWSAAISPRVVPAKAGIHTPCRCVFLQWGRRLAQLSAPGVMDPGVRRDDPRKDRAICDRPARRSERRSAIAACTKIPRAVALRARANPIEFYLLPLSRDALASARQGDPSRLTLPLISKEQP